MSKACSHSSHPQKKIMEAEVANAKDWGSGWHTDNPSCSSENRQPISYQSNIDSPRQTWKWTWVVTSCNITTQDSFHVFWSLGDFTLNSKTCRTDFWLKEFSVQSSNAQDEVRFSILMSHVVFKIGTYVPQGLSGVRSLCLFLAFSSVASMLVLQGVYII